MPAAMAAPRAGGTPEVTVSTTSLERAEALTGRLVEFSLTAGLKLELAESDEALTIPAEDILAVLVRGEGDTTKAMSDEVEVRLSGGDVLFGRPVGTVDDVVQIESRLLGRVEVSLERVDRWLNLKDRDEPRRFAAQRGSEETPAQEDLLRLSNGDEMRGTVMAIDERGVTLDAEGGAVQVPHQRLAWADLVAEAPPARTGLQARVRLVDGSQLTTSAISYSNGSLALEPFTGDRVTSRLERVARIDITGGKWVWISELPTMSGQHTPMLSLDWPFVEDANVLGRRMRIGGREFERGLGVRSESSLMFELAGQYREFVSFLGVDDVGGSLSDVTAEIRVDGRTAYRKEGLHRGQLVGPVRIDVRGAGRIELAALFGENGSIQDCFDWAGAGLVR